MTIKGIIIRVSPYKDTGAMINLLTPDGIVSFYVNDIYKRKSKSSILSSPLSVGDFTFTKNDNSKLLTFKEANLIIDTRVFLDNPKIICLINFLQEVTLAFIQEEDEIKIYNTLTSLLLEINNTNNVLLLALFYMAKILIINGLSLNVENCVISGKSDDLIALSIEDGGLISKNYFDKKKHIYYNSKKISAIKAIFLGDLKNLAKIQINKNDCIEIFNDLIAYFKNSTNTYIKSSEMLKKII